MQDSDRMLHYVVERLSLCNFLKYLNLPDIFPSNISKCVNINDDKLQNMKTHYYQSFASLSPIGYLWMVKKGFVYALIEFNSFFQ